MTDSFAPLNPVPPNIIQLIHSWQNLTVLVIGEAMLDCYLHGTSDRLCQEAPVPVVNVTQRQDFPGGAANVAANGVSLGASVVFLSVIGADAEGNRLQAALQNRRVDCSELIVSGDRATLSKQRILSNDHLLARIDQGDTAAIGSELETQLCDRLVAWFPRCDAVIVSDYGYGLLTPRLIQTLATLQTQAPRPIVVDSKQLTSYRLVQPTAVKPNYGETIRLLNLPKQETHRQEQLLPLGDRLLDLTGAKIVAVTLDQDGSLIYERGQPPHPISTHPAPAHHTSGAGDTFITTLTLALASGAPTQTATHLSTTATAIVVTQPGTTLCSFTALQDTIAQQMTTQQTIAQQIAPQET